VGKWQRHPSYEAEAAAIPRKLLDAGAKIDVPIDDESEPNTPLQHATMEINPEMTAVSFHPTFSTPAIG
jgi:hypothetical protein